MEDGMSSNEPYLERSKGRTLGLKTVESFHTHDRLPVGGHGTDGEES